MTDREKVIRAMECCAVDAECDHCPYSPMNKFGNEGCYQMHADALALLKAQEPRVMTLEEALGGEECWVEYLNGGCGYADCYLSYTAKGADIYRTMQHDFNVPLANYGKTWRCWTSRPTAAQREAIAWMT